MQIQDTVKSGGLSWRGVCDTRSESQDAECIELWQTRHHARGGEQQTSLAEWRKWAVEVLGHSVGQGELAAQYKA